MQNFVKEVVKNPNRPKEPGDHPVVTVLYQRKSEDNLIEFLLGGLFPAVMKLAAL